MRKTIDILGVPVDSITMSEAVERVESFLSEDGAHSVYTPNAEIIMAAQRDPGLLEILKSANLIVADGAGVVLASKLLGRPVPEKVSGVDLIRRCFKAFTERRTAYFLFGGKPGVAEQAAENLKKEYPGIVISDCLNGYFKAEDTFSIIERINRSKADVLLVALGAPKQERWIAENMGHLNVKVCMGVGGSLDIFAGTAELAPEFMRRNGFEWLFRLYKEPWRAKRMLDLPRFIVRVMRVRVLGK